VVVVVVVLRRTTNRARFTRDAPILGETEETTSIVLGKGDVAKKLVHSVVFL
jgi:hypothetical protein